MATYNLTSSIPNADDLRDGDIINCPYSGSYKMIKLPKGVYKLEVWELKVEMLAVTLELKVVILMVL